MLCSPKLFFAQIYSKLVLSEIMFKPAVDNGEFIEIYNNSETEPFYIGDYKIKYGSSSAESFESREHNYNLLPNSYAVIFEKDFDFENSVYAKLVAPGSLILYLDNNAFGRSGMSNSSDQTIQLLNPTDQIIGLMNYTANNDYGISEEKIILSQNDSTQNWGNSIIVNGTPGSINSLSPKSFDLAIKNFYTVSSYSEVGKPENIFVKVVNEGSDEINGFKINLYEDNNKDLLHDETELIDLKEFGIIVAGDSVLYEFVVDDIYEGETTFIAELQCDVDEFAVNNQSSLTTHGVVINEIRGDLVVNEIMYAPNDNEPEWIEILNVSSKEINLKNYQVADNTSSSTLLNSSQIMLPNDYLVVAKDSAVFLKYEISSSILITSFPSLNNSGDKVILLDSLNRVIDSLEYSPGWGGGNGTSLEKIVSDGFSADSENWKSSEDILGATPGKINSVTQKDYDITIVESATVPQFPLIEDEVGILALIKNVGKKEIEFTLKINEMEDDTKIEIETSPVITITPGDSIMYESTYKINNLTETKTYEIIAFSETDQDTSNNVSTMCVRPGYPAGSIVINEIMFYPGNDEPEWIEFYNNSDYDIELTGWAISDVYTTPATSVMEEEHLFTSHTYYVVAKDSTIYNYHREIPSPLVLINFANLNNDEDGVVLKDFNGRVIDSVLYSPSNNGSKGYSLERKRFDSKSNDINNWGISTDIEQSTPGRMNSITPKEQDLAIISITTTPRFPILNDNVYVNVEIKNLGLAEANSFLIRIISSKNDIEQILYEQQQFNLSAGDSMLITANNPVLLDDEIIIEAVVIYEADWENSNNVLSIVITPGYERGVVLINELMYYPSGDDVEWIEIVNNSNEDVNLKDWFVSDVLSSPTKSVITKNDCILTQGEFAVITADSNSSRQRIGEGIQIFQAEFGSLSNSKDGVVIYDLHGAVIDSLFYESSWGGRNGRSLERLSLSLQTCDENNWITSLCEDGSTCGKQNSIINISSYNLGDVVINEIMYDPADGNSEFIELYNTTNSIVSLGGWNLADESDDLTKICESNYELAPYDFLAVAVDSIFFEYYQDLQNVNVIITGGSAFSLSNSGECLKILDIYNNIIDSVCYNESWHNRNILTYKNKSLEKINPTVNSNDESNWSTCVNDNGATPGYRNSILTEGVVEASKLSVSPNPFSPDNDGYEDFTIISYTLSSTISQTRVKIFDSKGRLIRELINNSARGSAGQIIFDGLNNNGKPLKMGIYIIFMEALNSTSGVIDVLKEVVVVARKL